ncbi:MAG: lysylphosphatidylglycerol synthase transmembrane domain-containing protein [Bacilli bacterium]|nr:lysylphosphatidylglycerol synthase transmembrane domain-containing protein [Bacilli bacterium]
MKIVNNIKKNTIVLLGLTIIILVVLLKDDYKEIVNALTSMNILYILLAIFFFFLYIFFKAYTFYITVDDKEKISLKESYKHQIITQFFNGITPFSTGGQPMEIYMTTEHNISGVEATNISIQNFIFYQTALVIYGVLAVSYNYIFHIFPKTELLRKLVLLGFLINTMVAVALLAILISNTITKKIVFFFIDLLSKIKVVKNKEKTKDKVNKLLDEFHKSATELRNKKGLFTKGVILNFISLTCLYIIPLFIVMSLGDYTSLNPLTTLTSSAYVLLMGSFVPIPGASGGIEYGFLQFYGNFLSKEVISAVLIVWRFITYYLGVILGAFAFSLEKKVDKNDIN